MPETVELVHATVVAAHRPGADGGRRGVMLTGPSGAGKSDLALRLMAGGWRLVADDYVHAWVSGDGLYVRAPDHIAGRIEIRGLGLPFCGALPLVRASLVVRCVDRPPERLPEPAFHRILGLDLPLTEIEALHASAPAHVDAALRSLGEDRPLAY